MNDVLSCECIKKAVDILKQNQLTELPYTLLLPEVYLKNKKVVDFVKYKAKMKHYTTHFIDKNNNIVKSFVISDINMGRRTKCQTIS